MADVRKCWKFAIGAILPCLLLICDGRGDEPTRDLAMRLRELDTNVLSADERKAQRLGEMLSMDVRARRNTVNQRETSAWRNIQSRAEWENYRDARITALRNSLGTFPSPVKDLKIKVARTINGDGYRVENMLFESRPSLWVTANLYSPANPQSAKEITGGRPGILVIHSHHNPKTQSELQDMGMLWARQGCVVLVPDQLGHGERRQHPFVDEKSYSGSFRPSRQDYYFRYNTAMQLHVIGESLIGWMAWDMMRCVDLLLARPDIDPKKIILLGSVAGGGDPAAVTAAIDSRVAAVVPFNFGGPQPETTYPLPANAEDAFNYVGGGSWESTRNLRLSARDGFLPWVIVGSVAPRGLVYGHEFDWDREHDPVWARLQKIYSFYEGDPKLTATVGRGKVTGTAGPDNTHCNNIGAEHRKGIYPAFQQWFGIPVPATENQQRLPASDLLCLTPDVSTEINPKSLSEIAAKIGDERLLGARKKLHALTPNARLEILRTDWTRLLGHVDPTNVPTVRMRTAQPFEQGTIERISLEIEPGIVVPIVLLLPKQSASTLRPLVIGVAQAGKEQFLKLRAEAIAELLNAGIAVCLPDVRGTGETQIDGDSRGRQSAATSISSSELMLGRTLLGLRLRDVRSVLRYLRGRAEFDQTRIALWGDSFAPVNTADTNIAVPLDAERLPQQSEPLGALLALFTALFEENVRAVEVHGGLTGYQSLLESQFVFVPHDCIVPGALTAGDLSDVVASVAPRPVRLSGMVNGVNRLVSQEMLQQIYVSTQQTNTAAGEAVRLQFGGDSLNANELVEWFCNQLR